jgi:aspartyl protease family protein
MAQSESSSQQKKIGQFMIYAAWLLLLGLLSLFFQKWLDYERDPNRNLAAVSTDGPREVVLKRDRSGHYRAPGLINNEPVLFLLDTGATDVNIPQAVADRIGLQAGSPQRARTANGIITVYDTRADEVQLGTIALSNVAASINPHMHGDTVLLGMSFMKHLVLIQRDNTLTLRQE